MNQFDFIVNPKNGKNVNLKSKLGLSILNKYVQSGGAMVFDPDEEAHDIINKRRDDMSEMGRIFSGDIQWLSPITDPIYFAGDKVMIDHTKVAGSLGYSNAVGTIIDPSKINQGTCLYGCDEFPDQRDAYFRRADTYKLKYTTEYGQAIRKINRDGELPEDEADLDDRFIDYIDRDPRLMNYVDFGTRPNTSFPEYNRTTDNPYDHSFLSAIDEGVGPNKAKYLVEWETTDDSGHKIQVVTSATNLKPYEARLYELGLIE